MSENKKNEKNYTAEMSEVGRQGYEASVLARMQGRSGAYTKTGAKGIAHEIMANDLMNLKNITKPDTVAKLTKSPTAQQVDAVVMKGGKVAQRIQYKDSTSTSGVHKIVQQMQNGKYQQTQVHGTKETAKLCNELAAQKGISKRVKSTGISSKATQRVGDKFTGQMPKAASIGDAMKTTALTAGGITAGIEAVKSIANGDSLGEGTSHVVSKTAESVITAAASTAAAEVAFGAASTLLAASAIPVAGPLIAAGGVALGVGAAVGEVTDGLFDEVGDTIGEAVEDAGDIIGGVVEDVGDAIGEVVDGIGDAISDVCSGIGDFFDSLFF